MIMRFKFATRFGLRLKYFALIVAAFVTTVCGATVFAEPDSAAEQASGSSGTVVERDGVVLRVGYIPGTGFVEEDFAGHLVGYGYEYMEFLANYMRCRFEYVPLYSWAECGEKLNSGEIDILPSMPGYYKALPNVARTDHVIGRFPMEFVVGKGGLKEHMKIGTIPANCPTPSFHAMTQGEGFSYEFVNFPLHYDMEDAAKSGQIDGYVDAMLNPHESKAWAIFDRQSYRALVRADRQDLLRKMNFAMDQMLLYQPNIRDFLNNKYLRTDGFPLVLSADERKFLREKGKLTAVMFIWQRPFAFMENEQPKGIYVEILKRIENDLGVEIEILPVKTTGDAVDACKWDAPILPWIPSVISVGRTK